MSDIENTGLEGQKEGSPNLDTIQIDQLADEIKAGDDALNKLKVQNLEPRHIVLSYNFP